jgi:hypothetical protein
VDEKLIGRGLGLLRECPHAWFCIQSIGGATERWAVNGAGTPIGDPALERHYSVNEIALRSLPSVIGLVIARRDVWCDRSAFGQYPLILWALMAAKTTVSH